MTYCEEERRREMSKYDEEHTLDVEPTTTNDSRTSTLPSISAKLKSNQPRLQNTFHHAQKDK